MGTKTRYLVSAGELHGGTISVWAADRPRSLHPSTPFERLQRSKRTRKKTVDWVVRWTPKGLRVPPYPGQQSVTCRKAFRCLRCLLLLLLLKQQQRLVRSWRWWSILLVWSDVPIGLYPSSRARRRRQDGWDLYGAGRMPPTSLRQTLRRRTMMTKEGVMWKNQRPRRSW